MADEKKAGNFNICKYIILFTIFATIIVLLFVFRNTIFDKYNVDIIGTIIIIIFLGIYVLFLEIYTDIRLEYKYLILIGIFINFSSFIGTIINNGNYLSVFIINSLLYFGLFIYTYRNLKKYKHINYSPLKGTNYFMVAIFTAIIYLIEQKYMHCTPKEVINLIWLCYVVPLLFLQSLYEILDGKQRENIESVYINKKVGDKYFIYIESKITNKTFETDKDAKDYCDEMNKS